MLLPALAGPGLFLALAVSVFALSAPSLDAPWKRTARDASGRILWIDSLGYDTAGKLLDTRRLGPDGRVLRWAQYHYDRTGSGYRSLLLTPQGEPAGKARCEYEGEGGELRFWHWAPEEGPDRQYLRVMADSAGKRFFLRAEGRNLVLEAGKDGIPMKARLLGESNPNDTPWAEFRRDARGLHAATRFFGPEGEPMGSDSLLRDSSGRLLALERRDAAGKVRLRIDWTYGPGGEPVSVATADPAGTAPRREEVLALPADSLGRLGRARSRWPGAARTRACPLDWREVLPAGLEPRTFGGLGLGGDKAFRARRAAEPESREEAALEDSCRGAASLRERMACHARVRERAEDSLLAGARACRAEPNGTCIAELRREVEDLVWGERDRYRRLRNLDTLVAALLAADGERAYDDLVGRLQPDSQADYRREVLLVSLLKYRLEKAFRAFCLHPGKPGRYPRTAPKLPAEAAGWPPAIRDAWRTRQALLPPPDTAKPGSGMHDWQPHELRWALLAYLQDGDHEALEQARHFQSRGGCTGPRRPYSLSLALLIHDLEAGDLENSLRALEDEPERVRRLLACRGLDWEAFLLGGVPEGVYNARNFATLARYGGERAVEGILSLLPDSGLPEPSSHGAIEALGASLAAPGRDLPDEEGHLYATRFGRDGAAVPIADGLRLRVLARLEGLLEDNLHEVPAAELAVALRDQDWPGKEAALRRLATLPDSAVRVQAAEGLAALGKTLGPLPPLHPVAFRFTANGHPFAGRGLAYRSACEVPATGCRRDWEGSFSLRQAGEDSLERRDYDQGLRAGGRIELHNLTAQGLADTLFRVAVAMPERPEGEIAVDIPLRRVEVDLLFPPGWAPFQESELRIEARLRDRESHAGVFTVPVTDRLVFPAWGDGIYVLSVGLEGAPPWRGEVAVRGGKVRLRAALEAPGTGG